MQINLLKDVVGNVAGKYAVEIVDLLYGKKNVNEFLIAKKLKLTINQVRNILYKLLGEGLVSFSRKKDSRRGWYTYFWTLDTEKTLLFLRKTIIKEIEQFQHQLKSREQKRFYVCKTCGIEVTEENALIHDFICTECGQVYELADNKKILKEINNGIEKLKKQLKDTENEIAAVKIDKLKKEMRREKKERKVKKGKAKEKGKKRKKKARKGMKKKKAKKIRKEKRRKQKKKLRRIKKKIKRIKKSRKFKKKGKKQKRKRKK